MLKIIGPKGQKFHESTVESFLDLLKIHHNFKLTPVQKKKATFLIMEDETHGVYGGAVLYPQAISDITVHSREETYEDKFASLFSSFQPQEIKCWISRICFCLETEEVEKIQSFYRDLYNAFLAFGNEHNIGFIALTSFSLDTVKTPFHKRWRRRCMSVAFSHTTDGLKHGILSINGDKFMSKQKKEASLNSTNKSVSQERGV